MAWCFISVSDALNLEPHGIWVCASLCALVLCVLATLE